jgi:hypothetical protein
MNMNLYTSDNHVTFSNIPCRKQYTYKENAHEYTVNTHAVVTQCVHITEHTYIITRPGQARANTMKYIQITRSGQARVNTMKYIQWIRPGPVYTSSSCPCGVGLSEHIQWIRLQCTGLSEHLQWIASQCTGLSVRSRPQGSGAAPETRPDDAPLRQAVWPWLVGRAIAACAPGARSRRPIGRVPPTSYSL